MKILNPKGLLLSERSGTPPLDANPSSIPVTVDVTAQMNSVLVTVFAGFWIRNLSGLPLTLGEPVPAGLSALELQQETGIDRRDRAQRQVPKYGSRSCSTRLVVIFARLVGLLIGWFVGWLIGRLASFFCGLRG